MCVCVLCVCASVRIRIFHYSRSGVQVQTCPINTEFHRKLTHRPSVTFSASVHWVSIGSNNGLSHIRIFGAKPLSKPMLGYSQLDPSGQTWNSNSNTWFFVNENAFEDVVCEMAAILTRVSRGRWANSIWPFGTNLKFELKYMTFR